MRNYPKSIIMKTTLKYPSISNLKIYLIRLQNLVEQKTIITIKEVKTNSVFKINLIYVISWFSIILFLALTQLSNSYNAIKIITGIGVLAANYWLLKKYNL